MAIYFKGIYVVKGVQGEYCPDKCICSLESGWIYSPEDDTIFKMVPFGKKPIQFHFKKHATGVTITSIDESEEIVISNSWATYCHKDGGRVEDVYIGNKDIFEILDLFVAS